MNSKGNNNIPSSKTDDELLTLAVSKVFISVKDKYLYTIPDT